MEQFGEGEGIRGFGIPGFGREEQPTLAQFPVSILAGRLQKRARQGPHRGEVLLPGGQAIPRARELGVFHQRLRAPALTHAAQVVLRRGVILLRSAFEPAHGFATVDRHTESAAVKLRQDPLRRHIVRLGPGANLAHETGAVGGSAPTFEVTDGEADMGFLHAGVHGGLIMLTGLRVVLGDAIARLVEVPEAKMRDGIAGSRCFRVKRRRLPGVAWRLLAFVEGKRAFEQGGGSRIGRRRYRCGISTENESHGSGTQQREGESESDTRSEAHGEVRWRSWPGSGMTQSDSCADFNPVAACFRRNPAALARRCACGSFHFCVPEGAGDGFVPSRKVSRTWKSLIFTVALRALSVSI